MRQFIRHPLDIPIEYRLVNDRERTRIPLNNISQGGLCFRSYTAVGPGRVIHLHIPVRQPPFEADAVIVWCRKKNGHYEVGVKFEDTATAFAVRMIEQVCAILHYQREVLTKEGRGLSGQEAAAEWIAKFSTHFPP